MGLNFQVRISNPPSRLPLPLQMLVAELKAFDDTKAGVKGLVDAGIQSIPKIFIRPSEELAQELNTCDNPNLQVPIIDLKGAQQEEIAKRILSASSEWGMFQVVNHDIPIDVLEGLIEGIRRFNEEDDAAKKALYIRERTKQVTFNTNYDLYRSRAANWRDTLTVDHVRSGAQFDASQLPAIRRSSGKEENEGWMDDRMDRNDDSTGAGATGLVAEKNSEVIGRLDGGSRYIARTLMENVSKAISDYFDRGKEGSRAAKIQNVETEREGHWFGNEAG
ncbi:hypothetical protein Ancab_013136 [Ancistrocladus abbreviatus]